MKKRISLIIVLVIVVLSGTYLFINRNPDQDAMTAASLYVPDEPTIAVEAHRVRSGSVIPSIETSGLINGKNEAIIVSETRGVIEEVTAEIGSYLNEGDEILKVNNSIARLSMIQAEQQLESLEIDFAAVKRAYDSGNASASELTRTRGQLSGAKAAYEEALKRFENTIVKAPFDGFLADMEQEISQGNYISEGNRIGQLIDLSGIKIDLYMGDQEVRKIQKGTTAIIETGSRTLEGMVEAIALTSDRNTGSFRVIVAAQNPHVDEIKSGYPADVLINLSNIASTIIIPSSALIDMGGQTSVYVINEGTTEFRPVVTGVVAGNIIEILSGLEEGEEIVTSGLKSLTNGTNVTPRFAEAGGN